MYVPEILDPSYIEAAKGNKGPLMSRERLEEIAQRGGQAIIPVNGDCLEAAGVVGGGFVAVDYEHFPASPRCRGEGGDRISDICLCSVAGNDAAMLKEYTGLHEAVHIVGTRYAGLRLPKMNAAYCAVKIYGIAYASWNRDGKLLWKRDPSSFPTELPQEPTITGGNVGEIIPIDKVRR